MRTRTEALDGLEEPWLRAFAPSADVPTPPPVVDEDDNGGAWRPPRPWSLLVLAPMSALAGVAGWCIGWWI